MLYVVSILMWVTLNLERLQRMRKPSLLERILIWAVPITWLLGLLLIVFSKYALGTFCVSTSFMLYAGYTYYIFTNIQKIKESMKDGKRSKKARKNSVS